jgi:hypothetical protein
MLDLSLLSRSGRGGGHSAASSQGGGAFTAQQIPAGLRLAWYDPSDAAAITIESNACASLVNKWARGDASWTLVQATAGKRPTTTNTLGGLRVLSFDHAATQFLALPAAKANVIRAAFIVTDQLNAGSLANASPLLGGAATVAAGNDYTHILHAANTAISIDGGTVSYGWAMANGGAPNYGRDVQLGLDTSTLPAAAAVYSLACVSSANDMLSLGKIVTSAAEIFLSGRIGEVILLAEIPTADLAQRIVGYLAHKWGLTSALPATHTYKTIAPASDPVTVASTPNSRVPWFSLRAAAGITESGGNVSAWADQSGRGQNFAQATGASQPNYSATAFGGKPGVTFNGTSDHMTDGAGVTTAAGCFAFASVFNFTRPTNPKVAGIVSIYGANPDSRIQFFVTSAGSIFVRIIDAEGDFIGRSVAGALADGGDYIIAASYDGGSASSGVKIFVNGVQVDTTDSASGTFVPASAASALPVYIGSQGADHYANGTFAHFGLYIYDIGAAGRQTVEGYMAHDGGIPDALPADHPYRYFAPVEILP